MGEAKSSSSTVRQRGISTVELLVSASLSLIVMAGLHSFLIPQMFGLKTQEAKLEVQGAVRGALDAMLRELRMAGYRGPCPGSVTAFVEALPQRVRFQIDWNQNGTIETDSQSAEEVMYEFDSASGEIGRTVGSGSGSVTSSMVRGVTAPTGGIFQYFDSAGNPTSSTASIRRVTIQIASQQANPDPNVSGVVTASVASDVWVRNAALSCP